jgi:hypothetical protein
MLKVSINNRMNEQTLLVALLSKKKRVVLRINCLDNLKKLRLTKQYCLHWCSSSFLEEASSENFASPVRFPDLFPVEYLWYVGRQK